MTAAPFSKILGFLVRKDAEREKKKNRKQRRKEREKRKEMRVLRQRKNELLSDDAEMQEMEVEKELEENEAEESREWEEKEKESEERKEKEGEQMEHSCKWGKTHSEAGVQRQEQKRKMREFVLSFKRERREAKKGRDKEDEENPTQEEKSSEPEGEQAGKADAREKEEAKEKERKKAENDRRKRRGRRRRGTLEAEEAEEEDFENVIQFLRSLWRRLMREGLVGEEGAAEGSAHDSVRREAGEESKVSYDDYDLGQHLSSEEDSLSAGDEYNGESENDVKGKGLVRDQST
jgi:hypothetical protein